MCKNCLIIALLVVLGCNKSPEQETNIQSNVIALAENSSVFEEENSFDRGVHFFKSILDTNYRFHEFLVGEDRMPVHLTIFDTAGVKKILAISSKQYPHKTAPSQYPHFYLFAVAYDSDSLASEYFNKLAQELSLTPDELSELGVQEQKRIRRIHTQSKPGNLIVQSDEFVFSLVESCRETPIGGTWVDYENRFLFEIAKGGSSVFVLNSDCGDCKYQFINRRLK